MATMQERWAEDENLEGRYADVHDTEPRWQADGLEAIYGPDAPRQEPIPADAEDAR